jgi:hypothetical protein
MPPRIRRLLPTLGLEEGTAPDGKNGDGSRERLIAGLAELLATVADRSPSGVGLVVEDVHWADSATLDCPTLTAGSRVIRPPRPWLLSVIAPHTSVRTSA